MPLTLGLTGMDPATETALRAAFDSANARLGGIWRLAPDSEADYVVVDMDSMYGPMSWLRLHAAGKQVIALTAAQRSQADHRLAQPFDAASLAALLGGIAAQAGVAPAAPAPAPTPMPAAAGQEPAPREPAPVLDSAVDIPLEAAPGPAPAEPPRTADVPVREGRRLLDWLAPGRLQGRLRLGGGGETLLIDADLREYYGPAALKPLAGRFEAEFERADFEPLDAAAWSAATAALGTAMPLTRLVWFGHLLAGRGQLAPEHDPQARYRMVKWPQTEREFPKHFRIATAMMKGPATLPEIAEAAGVALAEVADFVNAHLASGHAEAEREPEPAEPPKPGLFGRLRGR